MSDSKKPSQEPVVCHVCKKEIPPSARATAEGREYTHYFCGAGCEQRWQQEHYNPRHAVKSE